MSTDTSVSDLIVNKLTYAQWKAAKDSGTLNGLESYEITNQDTAFIHSSKNENLSIWTGTQQQYDAITTKDSNTLYNVIDDAGLGIDILKTLYPIGGIFITTANTCPLATLIVGSTWELVDGGIVTNVSQSNNTVSFSKITANIFQRVA